MGTMRVLSAAALAAALSVPAAFAGEAAPAPAPAPGVREMPSQVQAYTPLPCLTPHEVTGDLPKLALSGGKGTLPLPTKGGPASVTVAPGVVGIETTGESGTKSTQNVVLPREGFSAPVIVNLEYADKSTGIAAIAFAHGHKAGEIVIRNLAAAGVQFGETVVLVIDENCNGKFNDAGEDAVLCGGRLAVPLGPTVVVGGLAWNLQVAENGKKLTFTPAQVKMGPAGLHTKEGWGRLVGAVIRTSSGHCILRPEGPTPVPAGTAALEFAVCEDGNGRRALVRGQALKLDVPEGGDGVKPVFLNLGPARLAVKCEYTNDLKDPKLTVDAIKAEAVTCGGGTITYSYTIPPIKLAFYDVTDVSRLPANTTLKPFYQNQITLGGGPLVLTRREQGFDYNHRYRIDLDCQPGLGPPLEAQTHFEVPAPPVPPKKK